MVKYGTQNTTTVVVLPMTIGIMMIVDITMNV